MRKNKFIVLASLCFILSGCETIKTKITGYKTYHHPTLEFAIDYPAEWKMFEGGTFGVQVQFLSPGPAIFLANANIATNRSPTEEIEALADLSVKQLSIILNNYKLETKAIGNLGNYEAVDLRGIYDGQEGKRKIRSVIAIVNKMQYVFTFSSAAEDEHTYAKTVNKMIDSFTLSP